MTSERNTHDDSQAKDDRPLALVLGATGGIGGALAAKLLGRGYRIRAMHRRPGAQPNAGPHFEWVGGDAMLRQDVLRAADGATVIVHAVNPPLYKDWDKLVLPMIDNTIAAARATGALIVMPGTVYNFDPDVAPLIGEAAPQKPISRKGAIRVALERRLEQVAGAGVGVLIVRAGDYFGPGAGNSWFQQMVKPGRPVRSVTLPGARGVGHQWAYLPDVAETMARLIARRADLPVFARFHMDGVFDRDGTEIAGVITRIAGGGKVTVRRFPWFLIRLGAPFVGLFRELLEMRYLWQRQLRMDNRHLVAFLGEEPHTPLEEALRTTLQANGCLPAGSGKVQPTGLKLVA
ncbi:NAD-dependent epimerase/dehydratase family protein [Rhizobium halophytocola]|uniref:Nucleoside-diphosphate-sugar epimerase n=1 Tax=Rhizobium halophytocola TaxID=735519 RepID=A0ABS4E3X7_9HYPH|nr:NAD-dependent epimerase/dehydratase family protein [Rhizobium halophytocola]MBP1852639.1 nucleoside-diphosphate-sugar epimerase [Rhizobium halophytocola]